MLSRQDRRENSIHGIFSTEEVGKREVAQLDLCGHFYKLFHCKRHGAEAFLMILQNKTTAKRGEATKSVCLPSSSKFANAH